MEAVAVRNRPKHVVWTKEEYGTGIPVVDSEHQQLFRLLNQLLDNVDHPERCNEAFHGLCNYTIYHFNHEEELMLQTRYSGYKAHKAAHEAFKKKMIAVSVGLEDSDAAAIDDLIHFLQQWIDRHIRHMDMQYIHFIKPFQHCKLYGLFFISLQHFVVHRFGERWWKKAVKATHSEEKVPMEFRLGERYSEELYLAMCAAISSVVRIPASELMYSLGQMWLPMMEELHPQFMPMLRGMGATLKNGIDSLDTLHGNLQAVQFKDMLMPHFRVVSSSEDSLVVGYQPSTPMRAVFREFVQGLLHHMAATVYSLEISSIETSEPPQPDGGPNTIPEFHYTIKWAATGEDMDESDMSEMSSTVEKTFEHSIEGWALNTLFPFHFVVDRKDKLQQAGTSLAKLLPDLRLGHSIHKHIAVTSPLDCAGGVSASRLRKAGQRSVFLTARPSLTDPRTITLRGQCLFCVTRKKKHGEDLHRERNLVFCGAPLFRTPEEFELSGLTLTDFAAHDSSLSSVMTPKMVSGRRGSAMEASQASSSSGGAASNLINSLFGSKPKQCSTPGSDSDRVRLPSKTADMSKRRGSVPESRIQPRASASGHTTPARSDSEAIIHASTSGLSCPFSGAPSAYPDTLDSLVRPSMYQNRLPTAVREALLRDGIHGDFPMVNCMLKIAASEGSAGTGPLRKAIVSFYVAHGQEQNLIQGLFAQEFNATDDLTLLLRVDSAATRVFTAFIFVCCKQWLSDVLLPVVRGILDEKQLKDTDVPPATSLKLAGLLFNEIQKVSASAPADLCAILSWLAKEIKERYSSAMVAPLLSNLLLLRTVNPLIINPTALLDTPPWNSSQRRIALAVTKNVMETLRYINQEGERVSKSDEEKEVRTSSPGKRPEGLPASLSSSAGQVVLPSMLSWAVLYNMSLETIVASSNRQSAAIARPPSFTGSAAVAASMSTICGFITANTKAMVKDPRVSFVMADLLSTALSDVQFKK